MHIRFLTGGFVDGAVEQLRTRLAKKELRQRKGGVVFPHALSPSEFLQRALDVEAAQ